MSTWNRCLVVAVAAALAVAPSTAAIAGERGKDRPDRSDRSSVSKQHGKGKGDARKAAGRAKFTVPGTVASTGATSIRIARKERGVLVVREFALAPGVKIKRNGARVEAASIRVSDKVVAKGSRIDGRLVVTKLKVEGRKAPSAPKPPAPKPPVDDSAPTTVPVSTPPPTIVI